MPFFGLTRCGRKALPSVGSFANCGALRALAARRLALRRLDCLRFGLAIKKGGWECGRSCSPALFCYIKTRLVGSVPEAVKCYVTPTLRHQNTENRINASASN